MQFYLKPLLITAFITLTQGCSMLPANFERNESHAYRDTKNTLLGQIVSQLNVKDNDHSSMYLISEGTDAFLARVALVSMAERSIDVQYYIWKSDIVGKLLMHKMLQAADKGVRIRILLDDLNLDSETKSILFAMAHHKNIQVHIYNPFSSAGYRIIAALANTARVNRRMHNKSFTVDSQYTIVGGRNIEENYFEGNERSNYADLDVVGAGPVINDVNQQFDIYFNSSLAIPAYAFDDYKKYSGALAKVKSKLSDYVLSVQNSTYAKDLKNTSLYKHIINNLKGNDNNITYQAKAHVIYDSPQKTLGKSELETTYMLSMMQSHVSNINNQLELISPYFVPGDEGVEFLLSLVEKGVKVKVITNSLASTDGILAQSGYARHRYNLLKGGIELYEFKPKVKSQASRSLKHSAEAKSALHAKTYIFDRKEVYIGSFNFDPRSAMINTELGIICESPDMAQYIASNLFDKEITAIAYKVILKGNDVIWLDKSNGKETRHTTQPETSLWRRFNLRLYSVLPIESQL